MNPFHFLPLVVIATSAAFPAAAQVQPGAATAAAGSSSPADCGTKRNTRHDHTGDRGASVRQATQPVPCPSDAAPVKGSSAKKKARHNHAETK